MIKKHLISPLIAIIILLLSFSGPSAFSRLNLPDIPYLDKMVHAGMYFVLTVALIFENRKYLTKYRNYIILSSIPFIFGTAIELFQSLLTSFRSGDFFDITANFIGILFANLAWIFFKRIFPEFK